MAKSGILFPNHPCPHFAQALMAFNYQTMVNLTCSLPINVTNIYAQAAFVGDTMATGNLFSETNHTSNAYKIINLSKKMAFSNYTGCNYSADSDNGLNLTCSGGEDGPSYDSVENEIKLKFMLEEGVLGVELVKGVAVMGSVDIGISNPAAILNEMATLKEDVTLEDLTANLEEFEGQRVEM